MTILLVIAFAVLMYAFRPNSLRQLSNDTVKDRDNERVSGTSLECNSINFLSRLRIIS